jgi:hypothetical protein
VISNIHVQTHTHTLTLHHMYMAESHLEPRRVINIALLSGTMVPVHLLAFQARLGALLSGSGCENERAARYLTATGGATRLLAPWGRIQGGAAGTRARRYQGTGPPPGVPGSPRAPVEDLGAQTRLWLGTCPQRAGPHAPLAPVGADSRRCTGNTRTVECNVTVLLPLRV